jgi:hypothetical protein
MFVLKTFIVYFRIALYPEANNEFYIDDQDYEEVGIICSEYNKHIENFQKCLCTKHQSKYVLSFLKNMFNNAQCDVLIGELKYENRGNFNCKLHIITKECEDGNEYGNNDDDDEQIEEIIGILLLPLFRTDTYHIMIDNKKYIVVPKMDYYEEDDDTNTDTDDDDDIELIYSDDE